MSTVGGGIGDAAACSGRDYAHVCRNLSANRTALSLHVYGGALERYATYSKVRGGRYRTDGFHATTRWPERNRTAATNNAAFAWKK